MPLPILVPIVLGAAGLFGLGKAAKAVMDNSEANDIAKSVEAIVVEAELGLEAGKNGCNMALRCYGERKLHVIQRDIQHFVELFGKLKNVELAHSPELDRLQIGTFTEVSLQKLQHSCSFVSDLTASSAAGAGAGALTAFGAYGGTVMLASAGTGTAIGTLSGAAATNATLAWLGGGTLAAGGYGVAGGTMVLGIMVAGPALLVLGSVLGAQASKKIAEAKGNLEKAKTYASEIGVVLEKLHAIEKVTAVGRDLLSSLQTRLYEANVSLSEAIKQSGLDYAKYSDPAKDIVFQSVKYAQLVKKVIDTPILNEDGALAGATLSGFQDVKTCLGSS